MTDRDEVYLPHLSKILAGDARVFSWHACYQGLRERRYNDPYVEILLDSSSARLLMSKVVPQFDAPSTDSRNAFNDRICEIKSTPAPNRAYDLGQWKSDTLWLCQEVSVSERDAFRVVIIEWQSRSVLRLNAGYTEAELASLRDAFAQGSNTREDGFAEVFAHRSDASFETEAGRRRRILALYLEERTALLHVHLEIYQLEFSFNRLPSAPVAVIQRLTQITARSSNPGDDEMAILDAVDTLLQEVDNPKFWDLDVEGINETSTGSNLRQISILLELLLLKLRHSPDSFVDKRIILHWLRFSSSVDFFRQSNATTLLPHSANEKLQAIVALISIAILSPSLTFSILAESTSADSSSYLGNLDSVAEIHNTYFALAEENVPQAAPATLAWALILNEVRAAATRARDSREDTRSIDQSSQSDPHLSRRNSHGSLQQTYYEESIESITNHSPVPDPVVYLLRCALEANHALTTVASLAVLVGEQSPLFRRVGLELLQELVTASMATIGYSPDVLSAQFAILTTPMYSVSECDLDMVERFVQNEFLIDSFLSTAMARFPYESLPFLRLCRLLAQARVFDAEGTQYVAYRLRNMESFTYPAVNQFINYQTVREDENLNLVALESPAYISTILDQNMAHTAEQSTLMSVGTIGEVISESTPPVIRWQHSYSCLSYLGTWLRHHYYGQLQLMLSPSEAAEDIATEIIQLVSTLLKTMSEDDSQNISVMQRNEAQESLISEFSRSLDGQEDIVYYICEIMEREVQDFRHRPASTFDATLFIACVNFLSAMVDVRPAQCWSSIRKSSLFGVRDGDSSLLAIVNVIETKNRDYPLSLACAKLLERAIDACPAEIQGFKIDMVSSATNPFVSHALKARASAIRSLASSLYRVFESSPSWTFGSVLQQFCIVNSIATSFERILFYSSRTGEQPGRWSSSFLSSSQFLQDELRPRLEDRADPTPILLHLCQLRKARIIFAELGGSSSYIDCSYKPLLSLGRALISIGMDDDSAASSLQMQIFDAVPLLCRILVFDRSSVLYSIQLLQDLLQAVAKLRPVSLLGHLGALTSISLLEFLSSRISEGSADIETAVWNLLASLISRNQQWLAISILTGSPPEKDRSSNHFGTTSSGNPSILSVALAKAVKVAELPQTLAVSVLNFLVEAQQNWPWIADSLQSERNLMPALVSYIRDVYHEPSATLKLAYRNKIAAAITDFATLYFHQAMAMRDQPQIKVLLSLIRWLADNALSIGSYNTSLHANLRKNFARKFSGMDITDIVKKRSPNTSYGEQYYYDLDYADKILAHEPYWSQRDGNQDQSFAAECRRANLNLSVVDSEILLFRSFKAFCIEHREWLARRSDLVEKSQDGSQQSVLVQIIQQCLRNNMQEYPPQNIFDGLLQSRADLAVSILQSLVAGHAKGFDVKALLKTSWDCARFRNGSLEQVLVDGDITYWRTMLTIVLLSLNFHVGGKWLPPVADHSNANLLRHSLNDQTTTILEIATVVVGHGFRTIVTTIQDQQRSNTQLSSPTSVSTQDLTLVLTILEAILRVSRAAEFISDLSLRLIASGVVQSCLLLYSWSHIPMSRDFDHQIIYTEESLRLLSMLSSLPLVAEEMAVEGVLSRLLNARVTQKLQNVPEGAGYADERPGVSFYYRLWAVSLLPICLNLAHSVGAAVAAEISQFLNQFPKQLERASTVFMSRGSKSRRIASLTMSVADEALTIALLSFILDAYRNAGASTGIDPTEILALVGYDEHKKALAEDITDITDLSASDLNSILVATNVNESSLIKQKEVNGDSQLANKFRHQLKRAVLCLQTDAINDDK